MLSIIALNGEEYADALQPSAVLGIGGGGIYDAMFARCAIKAKAKAIYTWNTRHYNCVARTSPARLRADWPTAYCVSALILRPCAVSPA